MNQRTVVIAAIVLSLELIGIARGDSDRAAPPTTAPAAKNQPSVTELLHSTQQLSSDSGRLTLVWWIPKEYWRVAMSKNTKVTPAYIDDLEKSLAPYVLMVIVDGQMGPFGVTKYVPEDQLRTSLAIKDSEGHTYPPLEDEDLDGSAKNLLASITPVLANSLGPMGKNMHFFAFGAKDTNGRPIADPLREGRFSIVVAQKEFKWRLPLGSLLPPKVCPKCGEVLSGAYKFCPYDGTALPQATDSGKEPDAQDEK